MGKKSDLSDYEKGQIDSLHAAGSNYSEIARRLGRSTGCFFNNANFESKKI